MISHILVIDDRISLPRFIAMELRAEGYRVSVCCGHAADLAIIQEVNPDLIVLNWELRCASGLEICRRLRSTGCQIPIVVITAEAESSCHLALKSGAQVCLTKPFSINDLLKAMEYFLKPQKPMVKSSCDCSCNYNEAARGASLSDADALDARC